ncbi:HAMP domain-containing sensor histidine kinase [Empedobacter sedimenti]|uniref:HAMP domain-containing sensor histidine kinase n=1 Tax=Empedobacter sedimenti TaxID=3042610 RepID=UPI0024A65061|nr:ATP-binding protein [Empedobacter sedimenti]
MRIKTKLRLGLGLLFLLIVLLAAVATTSIYSLKNDTQNILHDNYNSLIYAKSMMRNLNDAENFNSKSFEKQLANQELNATEQGEKELNQQIRDKFDAYKEGNHSPELLKDVRISLLEMMEMNMQAIEIKSEFAEKTANQAILLIIFTGIACIFIAFNSLIKIPSNIANPIQKLTNSIKEIASNNYKERVYLDKKDEFSDLAQSFNTMASKLEEYNESHLATILKQKTRMETLINNMHDVVIGLDEQMQVIFANNEAVKVTGLSAKQMVNKAGKDLALHNDLIRLLLQNIETEIIKDEKPLQIVVDEKEQFFTKEIFHIEIIPTGETIKQVVGHVIILRNITEFKELDAAKTRFIATVSHEFKTPISSMEMSLQLLRNKQIGTLNEEQNDLVTSIDDDVHRLLRITKELLNLTQIESGTIQMNKTEVFPIEIVENAVKANQTLAEQKHLIIETNIPNHLESIKVDLEKTVWVLSNLISNAIHYSHENARIWITIEQTTTETSFKVKDKGIGIPTEFLPKVFDRYFRVPGTHKEGTGLGLAISKEFIEAQKGTLNVVSEYGVGSEFEMRLLQ